MRTTPSNIGTVRGEAGRAAKVEVVGPDYAEVFLSVGDEIRRSDRVRQLLDVHTIRLRHDDLLKLVAMLQRAAEIIEAGRGPNDLARIYEGRGR